MYKFYFFAVSNSNTTINTEITLSFEKAVINQAEAFAASQSISLSRLLEYLLR